MTFPDAKPRLDGLVGGQLGERYCVVMRLPSDRILEWREIDRAKASALDIASTPEQLEFLEQAFLARLLLRDAHGRLTVEAVDQDAPLLLELGTVVVRPFEQDPSKARLSFRPASPELAAVRPARARHRPKDGRARGRLSSRDTPPGDIPGH